MGLFGLVTWIERVIQPWAWLGTEPLVAVATGAHVRVEAVIQS